MTPNERLLLSQLCQYVFNSAGTIISNTPDLPQQLHDGLRAMNDAARVTNFALQQFARDEAVSIQHQITPPPELIHTLDLRGVETRTAASHAQPAPASAQEPTDDEAVDRLRAAQPRFPWITAVQRIPGGIRINASATYAYGEIGDLRIKIPIPEHTIIIYTGPDDPWQVRIKPIDQENAPYQFRANLRSVHPHIIGNDPCWGDFTDAYQTARSQKDIESLMSVIRTFVEAFNPTDEAGCTWVQPIVNDAGYAAYEFSAGVYTDARIHDRNIYLYGCDPISIPSEYIA